MADDSASSHAANDLPQDQDTQIVPSADQPQDQADGNPQAENTFPITIRLPHPPHKTQTIVSTQDQAQDVRQSIVDLPHTFQYSCFHLEADGKRVPEFVDLSQIPGIAPDAELVLVEDPYTEKDARLHVLRVRELVGAAGDETSTVHGIHAGITLLDHVAGPEAASALVNPSANGAKSGASNPHAMAGFDLDAPGTFATLLKPHRDPPPKVVKSISLSPWNPPPYHLRSRGHLLYAQVTTNEGEQFQITAHITGFYVNKSTTGKFDPSPRTAPKAYKAHSLLTLISKLSPSFDANFRSLQEYNGMRDPLSTFQLSNAVPNSPWTVAQSSSSLTEHVADISRTQEAFLVSGADNAETLRDWNEEFQTTRELPKETVQDRVFRERVTSKLFHDYNEAATQGAVLIARGEIAPLNPTEPRDAQIFVYNNVFYSFGADGVGTFANEGGDEAARVATGKDVMGVKTVNQLDIADLSTPGTVIVDYLGRRIVAQSIVPGIFKQREPGEQQIDYGGVEGRDVVADNETFAPLFKKLSAALRIKKHPVWDKEGKRHELEASIETKGLLGTDGRKYALDLYRISPVDVDWIEAHWTGSEGANAKDGHKGYPHRMTVLRPELIDIYWRLKLREYVREEVAKKRPQETNKPNGIAEDSNGEKGLVNGDAHTNGEVTPEKPESDSPKEADADADRVDISAFQYALNPDVFSGQQPQSEEDKAQWAQDEVEVRTVSKYLLEDVLPRLILDLKEGDVGFPMDGQSLTSLLHKRGINVRYLGKVAQLADKPEPRLVALKRLAEQDMVSRAFKHIANAYLRYLPCPFAGACIAHLLNCLLGSTDKEDPVPEVDKDIRPLYPGEDFGFEKVTPESLQQSIREQVELRFRHDLGKDWNSEMKPVQMLREVALKLGLQLAARDYGLPGLVGSDGSRTPTQSDGDAAPTANGHAAAPSSGGKKKKKAAAEQSTTVQGPKVPASSNVFHAEDIYNIVPVMKEASPRSVLAEEALEAGRLSVAQNQRDLGQELLLESLSLHEQIYGILHAEVARVYYQLSSLFYGLDDKNIAVELARKAVIVSERTLGVDSHETVLGYLNLGLFEHAAGNTKMALTFVRHALDLWKIVYGPNHPDSITTINNAAVMLQHLKLYHDSRVWFEVSLEICQQVSGKSSVNTATLLFQLAQALALDSDSKAAVVRMREAYNIFHAELGPEDRNTKEAETWLEQLTQNAVSIAKHAKDVQARRMRRLNHLTPRVTLGTRPQPQAGQSEREAEDATQASGGRSGSLRLDERSIDELLRYIEGGEGAKQSTPKKKTTANPRARQQQRV